MPRKRKAPPATDQSKHQKLAESVELPVMDDESESALDPFYTELHDAAYEGNIRKIKRLIKKDPNLLNQVDSLGETPLHYAVLNDKIDAVKTLLEQDALINLRNNEGLMPSMYATDKPKIKELLLAHGALDDPLFTLLHEAAMFGDIKQMEAILKEDTSQLDAQDEFGHSPLLLAVKNNQLEATEYLLAKGADPYLVDFNQSNIIDAAELEGKETRLSRHIKKQIKLSPCFLKKLKSQFSHILEKAILAAKQNNKKILVILGESHGDYSLFEIEEAILSVAKQLKISHLLEEQHNENMGERRILSTAKNWHHMHITGVDNHPIRKIKSSTFEEEEKLANEGSELMNERNEIMFKEINSFNQDAVLITGRDHLKGLLELAYEDEDFGKRYHVVPFNLGSIFSFGDLCSEEFFAVNPANVIQLSEKGFSDADMVAHWNERISLTARFTHEFTPLWNRLKLTISSVMGYEQQPAAQHLRKSLKIT